MKKKFTSLLTATLCPFLRYSGVRPSGGARIRSAYQDLPYRKLPQTDKYATMFTTLSEDLQSIVMSGLDPEEGLVQLEKKMNSILAN
ncbi:hypothetical protein [Paenibacillus roseipurpureus]|uniref:Uncharacterized protein n=1 Tax=Paenibacillus roseopurpureus TaxID=2918901 RepID=A0AA96LLF6_9BACL|nr:hypothetical protein [Paenibacillus sp. MBLB1832]WNR43139.1 hypothetical protein MJB10_18745 [Paenibacillus sp. MBLB1832]